MSSKSAKIHTNQTTVTNVKGEALMNKVKNIILFILLIMALLFTLTNCSENVAEKQENSLSKPKTPQKIEKEIMEDIKNQFAFINNNVNRYSKVLKDLFLYEDGGQKLDAYFEGNNKKKIVITSYSRTMRSIEEYYYGTGGLFFVFNQNQIFEPLPPDYHDTELVDTKENRYYFSNNKMIRWLDENKRQVSKNDPEFTKKQNKILNDSRKYTAKAK